MIICMILICITQHSAFMMCKTKLRTTNLYYRIIGLAKATIRISRSLRRHLLRYIAVARARVRHRCGPRVLARQLRLGRHARHWLRRVAHFHARRASNARSPSVHTPPGLLIIEPRQRFM